jgi:MerR family transcriptional regulator/heat shock protein HspR
MSDSTVPNPISSQNSAPQPQAESLKRIKIGEVARHFAVSVDLLRLYEREGLIIPLKSAKGTRYFTVRDYPWIATVIRLVREARLNFAGIRRLLALLPCWDIRTCGITRKHDCEIISGAYQPCWINRACCEPADCYACDVYRSACRCENLKAFIAGGPA